KERFLPKIHARHFPECPIDRRHHRTDDHSRNVIAVEPCEVNRLRVSTPYSSTVCSRAVVSRQFAISCGPRNTPSTVFVFPTSIVSSIYRASATSPAI